VLCVVFGSLILTAVLFMEPGVKRPQFVGERKRLPITSTERKEEPRIPYSAEKEGIEGKQLEGRILEEGGRVVPESPDPSEVIQENGVGEKVFILGEKKAPKEEREVTVAEGKEKRPEIEGKEEQKTKVAVIEEPKGRGKLEGKFPTGRYTLNIASFRDKGNADRLMKELEEKGYDAFVEQATISQKGTWYRVAVGRFSSRGEALAFAQGLKGKGINFSFVRELKEVEQ
jgi:septal ring-binding cell division protein DamX